jgi:hypothetical protein
MDDESGRASQRIPLLLRCVNAFFAVFLGYHAYLCLEGYLHGVSSPAVRSHRWPRSLVVPLYASAEQALFLAVSFGIVAVVFAYFALRPTRKHDGPALPN